MYMFNSTFNTLVLDMSRTGYNVLNHRKIYIGVGASPAGPVLARSLFRRFNNCVHTSCAPITAGPLQKFFLLPCYKSNIVMSLLISYVSSVVCTGPQIPLLPWHIALVLLGVLVLLVAVLVIISGIVVACGCKLAVFYGSN